MYESVELYDPLRADQFLQSSKHRDGGLSPLNPGSILDKGIRIFSALLELPSAVYWVRFLADLGRQHKLPVAPLDTVAKPFRTFAVHGLSVKQRCSLLRAHYKIIAGSLSPRVFSALWAGARIPVGSLCGRNKSKYHIVLEPAAHCGREGEYSFTLIAQDGFELAKLTFILTNSFDVSGETQLLIGGLQGPSSFFGGGSKERVIKATRELSGLRPKMAVFVAAAAFGKWAGATSLLAVSNRTHTINCDAWYQRRRLVADYDKFWIERGGASTRWGFKMPMNLDPRSNCPARNKQRRRVAECVSDLFNQNLA